VHIAGIWLLICELPRPALYALTAESASLSRVPRYTRVAPSLRCIHRSAAQRGVRLGCFVSVRAVLRARASVSGLPLCRKPCRHKQNRRARCGAGSSRRASRGEQLSPASIFSEPRRKSLAVYSARGKVRLPMVRTYQARPGSRHELNRESPKSRGGHQLRDIR
jgi:hypothetical protein